MASLSLSLCCPQYCPSPSPSPRWQSKWPIFVAPSPSSFQTYRLQNSMALRARGKKDIAELGDHDLSSNEGVASEEAPKTVSRAPRRTKKKTIMEASEEEEGFSQVVNDTPQEGSAAAVADIDDSKKIRKTRKKVATSPTSSAETKKKTVRRKKTEDTIETTKDQESNAEDDHLQWPSMIESIEGVKDDELGLTQAEDEDISFTYSWPPLVCCYGAAQHAFIPSGRPSNRMINYEIHDRMKDALWSPEKFVRAPGSSPGSVAIALSVLGGRVAFMGKLGDDTYGQAMLYYLNENKVQTRSVSIDTKKLTAVSHMKIGRRGKLRVNCVKPCAEDSLLRSEIHIDVLKEAKMFYFNSSSLLEIDMRATTLQAIKTSKKLGGLIFFDLNLPLPFWKSSSETKMFIQEAWSLADIIEVTKQELEFLCGIEPSEKFDTNDNDKSKFIHHAREVIMPLWHENLKVLFVTNGTSKIHYYTQKHNGSVLGMEDAPISPFTCDMSASGDGVVAGLLRMLTVQPDLITDKKYLERTIKYAIDCGVIDQWIQGRTRGFPPNEDMEEHLNSDPNGIESITEMQHRTLQPVS